uniref:Ig-like domain-containing protein n=1 Tax=Neolamprologus brichardi TaxID=32507 RepID=A0A3Q4I753_NEOBR
DICASEGCPNSCPNDFWDSCIINCFLLTQLKFNFITTFFVSQTSAHKQKERINIKDTLKLTCSAESTPSARFTWFLNGTEILTILAEYIKEEVELSDSGNYTCQAWNNITERTSSSAMHGLIVTVCLTPGSTWSLHPHRN